MTSCSCGSTKTLDCCCGPYLAGAAAPTAEALMRSRYSAYALGNVDYLQKTSAAEALLAFDRAEIHASLAGTEWLALEILDRRGGGEGDDAGTVTFRARFFRDGSTHILSERSEFRRIAGEWRYCRGDSEVVRQPVPSAGRGRNEPCPCGSGKKYKKCHGA